MGRTINTTILRADPIPSDVWQKINSAASAMKERFTWTCEDMGPFLLDEEGRRQFSLVSAKPPFVQALDLTKVASDEWNACLIVRFMRWVSTLLPDATVELNDEGDYVLAGSLIFEKGLERLDTERIARQRAYLESNHLRDHARWLDTAVRLAERYGIFFSQSFAAAYADRKEIVALGIPTQELARLTLEDVAGRIRFPWQELGA